MTGGAAGGRAAIRRTKLVCTIGPATADRIDELVAVGMDVARLNFSHGTRATLEASASGVAAAAEQAGRRVALLADLSGPKIRLGELDGGVATLVAGERFMLRPDAASTRGDDAAAWVSYPALAKEIRPGDRILLADGAAELRVVGADRDVETEIVRGGTIRSRAGVSIPSERLGGQALTDKDRSDVPIAVSFGAHYIAQSFVRRPEDVSDLRRVLGPNGPPIVAKIETRPAIDRFDAILDVADAVMIARGDMGVELPYEDVPIIQKQLVRRALDRGVPSIVATQMLESMVSSPRPTRAEASDVANAVFDGADAIMLSGETAIGANPILAAEAAIRICELCEKRGTDYLAAGASGPMDSDAGALAFAAVKLADAEPEIAGIACYTRTGRTARILSSLRPRIPIFAFSPEPAVVDRLALVHGVVPAGCMPPADTASRLGLMANLLVESERLAAGSAVVLVASTAEPGTGPNLLEVHRMAGYVRR